MTERRIYERIAEYAGSCCGISCSGTNNGGAGVNDIPCPFNMHGVCTKGSAQNFIDTYMEDKMEQKYGKVIFDPTSEEAKALEGRDVEGCLSYDFLSSLVCKGKMKINEMCSMAPFIISGRGCTFIRAIEPQKEPSYAERQKADVEKRGLKVGTRVRIARNFIMNENGCIAGPPNECVSKYEMVGKVFPIECIEEKSIRMNGFLFPYFVLEVVNDEYRPFTDEEMIALYGKTLVDKNCLPQMVVGLAMYSDGLNVLLGDPKCLTAIQLFNSDYTLDGHKCGVKV